MMLAVLLQIIFYALVFFVLIFVGIAFFNEVLIFSFLLVDYSLKSLYKPQEYPPAPISLYIKNFCMEFAYIMRKFIYLPLKWVNITVNPNSQAETAILLVHGYCRNQTDWLWMRKQLKDLNCPIFCVNLAPMFASIEDITKQSLVPKIEQIKNSTKCKQLIIVGHSMGGLVSSYYTEYLDTDNFVKTIVTIGSPYYGTRISVVGNGDNAKDMCPGSKFLTELHHKLHTSTRNYYQIASRFDNMIFPWQSALLEHIPSQQQYVLAFAAHLCMLQSKDVAEQLRVWLRPQA